MAEPIRVAHVIGKMVGGGVEAVVMNYYRHIDRMRVQFDFLVDADSTLIPREEIEALGGRLFIIPPYQNLVAYQRELTKLFKEEGWKIVHSHINTISVFPLRSAKKAGVPIRIAHSHATMGKGEIKRNILKIVLRLFANAYPTDCVACSEYAGKWLFGEGTPFTVIPNAVDVEKFKFDSSTRRAIRQAWGVSDNCCVVGNLGRLESTKNQSFLIDAFALLHAAHTDSLLIIAGSGSLRESLELKVDSLGLGDCVRFLGQTEEVGRLYQGMDVFALPSLYEGFGMALLEAQLSGVPCVASNRVSSEVVLSDNCRLVSLEAGADIWATAIWTQFVKGSSRVGAEDVFNRFDVENAAKELTEYYLQLVEGARR